MSFKGFRSRKLLLILAFLLIDIHSIVYYKIGVSNPELKETADINAIWIVDDATDRCLSPYSGGFDECSELNIWIWTPINGSSVLKIQNDRESDHIEEGLLQSGNSDRKGNCLGRDRWRDRLALMSCATSPLSPALWKFNFDKGMLFSSGVISTHFGAVCVTYNNSKQHNDSRVLLGGCSKYGYRVLRFVHVDHTLNRPLGKTATPIPRIAVSEPNISSRAVPSVTCPVTSLALPSRLDLHLPGPQQVLVGGGAYTKTVYGMRFKIYSMAWYLEEEAARRDPALRPFRDMTLPELQASPEFFQALSSEGSFDRTLLIKLAMTLRRDLLVQGLVDELPLRPDNARLLSEGSFLFLPSECPEGLEILITLRHANASCPSGGEEVAGPFGSCDPSACRPRDLVEFRIGSQCVTIAEAGLAEDFFRQFFRPDQPVCAASRLSLVQRMPQLFDPLRAEEGLPQERQWGGGGSDGLKLLAIARSLLSPHQYRRVAGLAQHVSHRWQVHFHHLILKRQRAPADPLPSLLIILYFALLILLSLPPALVRRGIQKGVSLKNKCNSAVRRTLSRTSSLVKLAKPADLEMIYFHPVG